MAVLAKCVTGRQTGNHIPLARGVRIVGGGKDDAQSNTPVPFGFDLIEGAVDAMLQQSDEVGLEAHQDRLGFRIAQAAVEFQSLQAAILADHQTGIQEAGIGDAILEHALHGRQDDFAHRPAMNFRRHAGRGRIGAHTTGIRPLIAVKDTLVILTGRQRQDVLAVNHDDEAGFLAIEELLDHDAGAGVTQLVAGQHVVDGGMRFFQVHGDDHPLAGGQTVSLDDDGRPLGIDVSMRCGSIGEGLEFGRGDVVPGHEALGEILGRLQLRCFLGRAKNLQATIAENIDHTGSQRRLRPDDRQQHLIFFSKISQRLRIRKRQVFQLMFARRARITRSNIDLLQPRRLGQLPGHGMFAATGANDE